MKVITSLLITLLISVFALPVHAASAVQVWECKMHDGKTQDDVIAVSKTWLDAAKTMKDGAELKVYVNFPIASTQGFGEFVFVLVANDMATWGSFMNGYGGSAAAKADEEWEKVATCSGISLEASFEIE
jgi:hypothetical protein